MAVARDRSPQWFKGSAYMFGWRKDNVFVELKKLLEPFGIKRYCTDA
jgi:IS1 family transposase